MKKMSGMAAVLAVCMALLSHSFVVGVPLSEGMQSPEQPLTRLAFGSCSKHDRPQPLWSPISDFQPQLWIWLGDVVYADTKHFPMFWEPSPVSVMKAKYDAQKARPAYHNFSSSTPIIGTWDDHDYGVNNGGAAYLEREQSKQLFLDFFDEPKTSARWTRNGVYGAYTFGPAGKRVKVILLDVRYNRDDPTVPDRDILGEEQWQWFERELRESDAQINFVGSGIQVLPRDKPVQEKWTNFPRSLARLEKTLQLSKGTVVLLSGDVHYAEIFKTRPRCGAEAKNYEGIYEITSSGMTHCLNDHFPLGFGHSIFNAVMGSKWRVSGGFEHRNFGTIEIAWGEETGRPTEIKVSIRGEAGQKALEQTIVVGAKSDDEHRCMSDAEVSGYESAQDSWMTWHSDVFINSLNYAILASPAVVVLVLAFLIYRRRSQHSNHVQSKSSNTKKRVNKKKTK